MLTMKKETVLKGESRIDGAIAESHRAEINSVDPVNMTITSVQVDKAAYKAIRAACRADRAAFEDAAYELQEEMMAENKTTAKEAE